MPFQKTQKFCKSCDKNILAERKGTNHILHLLLCFFTGGIWIPIWILHSIRIGGWRCPVCGSKTFT